MPPRIIDSAPDLADIQARTRLWLARRALTSAPDHIRHVRAIAVGGQGEAGEQVTEMQIPLQSLALMRTDELYRDLADWCAYFADRLGQPAPLPARAVWRYEDGFARGYRPAVTPDGAAGLASLAAMWLLIRLPLLVPDEMYEPLLTSVTDGYRDLERDFPLDPPPAGPVPQHPRPCPHCRQKRVHASVAWLDGEYTITAACDVCGWQPETLPDVAGWLE